MIGKNCQAFTTNYNTKVNALITEVGVSLPFDPKKDSQQPLIHKCFAIWDTGATGSAITEEMAKELGLKPVSKARVQSVHSVETKNVYLINIYLPSNVGIVYERVTECKELSGDRLGILIGMDIIGFGDFAVTNMIDTTLTYRIPSIEKIDFVELARMGKRENVAVGRNDKCPCGSGKKYKKCCGK